MICYNVYDNSGIAGTFDTSEEAKNFARENDYHYSPKLEPNDKFYETLHELQARPDEEDE